MLADRGDERVARAMPGLEPDNLLAFLALLGLLRSLEAARAEWNPRAFWKGSPWVAHLSLAAGADELEIAEAANEGILSLAEHFDVDSPRKNVDFTPDEYRRYAERIRKRNDPVGAALASALTAECAPKRGGRLAASPLVLMSGQGHQKFLERIVDIPAGKLPNRLRTLKRPPDLKDPAKVADALFQPWRRKDDTDGFRWDPEEDQRYALQYREPSKVGAPPTVAGANRLAAIGFLSFSTVPRARRIGAAGALYSNGWNFVWPIWTPPLSRRCIEALLNHRDLLEGRLSKVRLLGVAEIFRARRVANGDYVNVARGRPVSA